LRYIKKFKNPEPLATALNKIKSTYEEKEKVTLLRRTFFFKKMYIKQIKIKRVLIDIVKMVLETPKKN
jgi:hypothetical protein